MDEIIAILKYFVGNGLAQFVWENWWLLVLLAITAVVLLYCEVRLDRDNFELELQNYEDDEDDEDDMDVEDFMREEVSDE